MSLLHVNDKSGEYPESYYAATASYLDPFAPVQGEIEADVCVVGGGYSGLSAALHLRQRGYDVALLDAHRVGWGASGRNGGHVGTGQNLDPDEMIELVGPDDARKLWQISQDAKALVTTLITDLDIECDYRKGCMHANHKKRFGEESKRYVEFLNATYDYDEISYLDQSKLRSILATEAYFDGTLDTGGYHLHPLRFVLGLARACVEAGVRIFERSEVTQIVEGQAPEVKTAQGVVRSKHVILAMNGYQGRLNRRTADRVIPINSYVIATEPLSETEIQAVIANGACVSDSKFVVNYYRISDDRRLVFGGRESYRDRFVGDIKNYVRKAMLDIYPQLEHTKIDYGWGGTLGLTMNRMPHFEWLSPNMITIGGYSGHGIMMATLGGALAAEAISGVAERFDVMERVPTPTIPGGYHARLPLLALGMAYYSLKDRL
jgi:gamma-glutamylputrescine oxidase